MKKLRLAAGIIILIAPLFILSVGYKSDKFAIYLILSLPLIIKGVCEVIRYYTKKGINSYDNYLLTRLYGLHKVIFGICIALAVAIPSFIWLYVTKPSMVIDAFGEPQPILFISMVSILCYSLLSIVDFFILKSKSFTDKENIRQSGKEGETKVINALEAFCSHNSSYEYFHNILLKYQEFDSILVGEKGIFNIEVKNYSGEKTVITIDSQGNWFKEKYDKKTAITNPLEQVHRHHEVLESIFHDKYHIIDILVIANSDNIIMGSKNTLLNLVKLDALPAFINSYKVRRKLTNNEIDEIVNTIEEYKQDSRDSNY